VFEYPVVNNPVQVGDSGRPMPLLAATDVPLETRKAW
jgi:hypothetical protein